MSKSRRQDIMNRARAASGYMPNLAKLAKAMYSKEARVCM
jgi:hypothetical protein